MPAIHRAGSHPQCPWLLAAILWTLTSSLAAAQQHIPGYNYSENDIPPYTLLNPLQMSDGALVKTKSEWWHARRPQIIALFQNNVYGRIPAAAERASVRVVTVEKSTPALDGLARREQIDLVFAPPPTGDAQTAWRMRILLYLPAHAHGPVPVIFGLNFDGNQAIFDDPGIEPTPVWIKPHGAPAPIHVAPAPSTRGTRASEWQLRMVLSRGYALATAYYGDIEPDFKGERQNSVRALFGSPASAQAPNAWGALAAWAWSIHQAVAYLRTNPAIDPQHIAVTGHSRLAKAADWAAATDPHIAALLSTESGKGGQSIQRRELGETVYHLEHSFPYWFCPAYAQWVGHDQQIPADGNLLLSLIAPRPLYVASAQGDEWSDPRGEFLSARSASQVYRLLGVSALAPNATMPPVNQPIGLHGFVAYHIRTGKHDVTAFDWEHYLDFLDLRWATPQDR